MHIDFASNTSISEAVSLAVENSEGFNIVLLIEI